MLRNENSTLREENSALRGENSSLKEENIALQQEITHCKQSKPGWWEGLGTRLITGFKSSELYDLFGHRKLYRSRYLCTVPVGVNVGMASEADSSSIDDSLLSKHIYSNTYNVSMEHFIVSTNPYPPGHGDHDEIMSFLHSLNDKNIYDLGIALGISHQRLTDANKGASFLGNVILDWLNRVDKVGRPSWRSLVSALKDPMVKQTGIANNIAAKKHRT